MSDKSPGTLQIPNSGLRISSGQAIEDGCGDTRFTTPGIELWGHSIILNDESEIRCRGCDKEEDIPELLTMSSGFREVVYKMYVLGKFRKESCNPDPRKTKDSATFPPKNQGSVKAGNMYWSGNTKTSNSDTVDQYIPQGTRMTMDGDKYVYHGDGQWIDEDRNIAFGTVDLSTNTASRRKRNCHQK